MTELRSRPLPRLTLPGLPSESEMRTAARAMIATYLPELTDRNDSAVIIRLIDLLCAFWGAYLLQNVTDVANEAFLATSSDWDFLATAARAFGYHPSPGNGASVILTLTRTRAATVATSITREERYYRTARSGTTASVRFEMAVASVILPAGPAGTSVSFLAYQGQRISSEILGTADGTELLVFRTAQYRAVPDSETITVQAPTPGALLETWSLATGNNLLLHGADDHVYERSWDSAGKLLIMFGDGTHGAMPLGTVRATYRVVPDGEDGNAASGTIVEMVPADSSMSVTNAAAATGWEAPDDEDTIRFQAARNARIQQVCVADDDAPALVERDFPAVGRCWSVPGERGENTLGIRLIDADGDPVTDALAQDVLSYVEARNPATELVIVAPGEFTSITLAGTVYGRAGYTSAQVTAAAATAIAAYFGPLATDAAGNRRTYPGQIIQPEEFASAIMSEDAVAYVRLTSPTAAVNADSTKLPQIVSALTVVEG